MKNVHCYPGNMVLNNKQCTHNIYNICCYLSCVITYYYLLDYEKYTWCVTV